MMCVIIEGLGAYVPEKILTNEALSLTLDTSDEWIRTRSGIRERRIAAQDQPASALGTLAAKQALERAKIDPQEVDLLITATFSADRLCPSLACTMQSGIGLRADIPAFDVSAVCCGFVYALEVARSMMLSGPYKKVLVVGAEKLSSLLDWQDRSTCVLFGDGAGACVLGLSDRAEGGLTPAALLADGSAADLLYIPAGGSAMPASAQTVSERAHYLKMNGKEVFKHAVRQGTQVVRRVLDQQKISANQLDWIVPHQANIRIVDALARELEVPMERVFVNLDRYGNTSAASIPIALEEACQKGLIQPGHKVMIVGCGAGFTCGAMLLHF